MEVDDELNADEIIASDEYKFPLYRHWSIYDSMYHSQYLATRLGVWKEIGKKKLQTIFVKLGISLLESSNKWHLMLSENKKIFLENLEDVMKDFDLTDITYQSFYRNFGYKIQLCASDAALAASALLECNTIEYFWKAYDSLSEYWKIWHWIINRKFNDSLAEGINKAIQKQQALLKQSITTFEKQLIVRSGPFRYATVNESDPLFVHPLSVHRLGVFIMEIIQVLSDCDSYSYEGIRTK
jgi:cell division control protein 45